MSQPLRIVFMGTPGLARTVLGKLAGNPDYAVVLVVSQPDRPKGRNLKLLPTPVKELAVELGLTVAQPEKARQADFVAQLQALAPDLIVVAAYGQILPQAILDIPRYGCLNVHTSLLPKLRGAAPIQRAILTGEEKTGVTIMKMDAGLDTGDILSVESTFITAEDTAETLHDRLADLGGNLLNRTIPEWISGKIVPQPQPHELATHAPKIRKEEGHVNWSLSAGRIANLVRGLVPWPGAFTFLPTPPRPLLLKIWSAEVCDRSGPPGEVLAAERDGVVVACGEGAVRLTTLQLEGARRMSAAEFLSGHPLRSGVLLDDSKASTASSVG
jgi:methionyl-tRNA formyltransferase